MDEHTGTDLKEFGDKPTSDIIVRLKNRKGKQELFYLHSFILKSKSSYFACRLSDPSSDAYIEINCTEFNYDHHLKLLKCLYLPPITLLDSWESVRSVLGVLQVAAALDCVTIVQSCIQYLEAVPWEESEEDEIIAVVSRLGPITMPVLARIQPVDFVSTKNVFISALRFATSVDSPCPPFGDELRTSAQEQVEYMLGEDEDMPLVTADNEVILETRTGLSNTFSMFEREVSLLLDSKRTDGRIMHCISILEWMSNILLKMGLMDDFVSRWIDMSESILHIIGDKKLVSEVWDLKVKLVHVTSKVLDAVGYGTVILPSPRRVQLMQTWHPYIRKLKPTLDSLLKKDAEFPHRMNEDLSARRKH